MGDINRIRQILNNLLGNAVKFTDCGSVILRVKASSLDEEHSSLLWQVSDTGKGIAQEDQGHIFEPFTKPETILKEFSEQVWACLSASA